MNGEIWVESEPGQGSCFHFTTRVDVAEEPAPAPHVDRLLLSGIPVLVVDDNATNRRLLVETLRLWGMAPAAVESGAEALSQLRQAADRGRPFALVVTDLHMPEMDGFEFASRIRQTQGLVSPIVMMLTSGEQRGDVERCRELGIVVHLTKTVRRAELAKALANALGTSPRPTQSTPSAPGAKPASGLRILLAEDNLVNQRVAVRILEKEGHTVVVAATGLDALQALGQQSFDLVLMDVQMPDMDGLEATAAIRADERVTGAHIPIIAMTAHAMNGDRERCLAAGMDDYIPKPISMRSVVALVARHGVASPAA